MKYFSTI